MQSIGINEDATENFGNAKSNIKSVKNISLKHIILKCNRRPGIGIYDGGVNGDSVWTPGMYKTYIRESSEKFIVLIPINISSKL